MASMYGVISANKLFWKVRPLKVPLFWLISSDSKVAKMVCAGKGHSTSGGLNHLVGLDGHTSSGWNGPDDVSASAHILKAVAGCGDATYLVEAYLGVVHGHKAQTLVHGQHCLTYAVGRCAFGNSVVDGIGDGVEYSLLAVWPRGRWVDQQEVGVLAYVKLRA